MRSLEQGEKKFWKETKKFKGSFGRINEIPKKKKIEGEVSNQLLALSLCWVKGYDLILVFFLALIVFFQF